MPVSTAAFATKPLEANCVGACQWASFGEKRMAKSSFIRMKQSPARSALSSNDSPNSAPHGGSGFGSVPKVCLSRCKSRPPVMPGPIRWVTPTYTALHHILTNPVYAGAYTYGKTKYERYVDEHGAVRKRSRHLPMDQWSVLIQDHHPGFIDWATFRPIRRGLIPTPGPGRITQEVP